MYNILYKKEYKYDNPLIHILIEHPIRQPTAIHIKKIGCPNSARQIGGTVG